MRNRAIFGSVVTVRNIALCLLGFLTLLSTSLIWSANASPRHPLAEDSVRPLYLSPEGLQEVMLNYMMAGAFSSPEVKVEVFDNMVAFLERLPKSPPSIYKVNTEADLRNIDLHSAIEQVPMRYRLAWLNHFTHIYPVLPSIENPSLRPRSNSSGGQTYLSLFFYWRWRRHAVKSAFLQASTEIFLKVYLLCSLNLGKLEAAI